MIFNLEKKRLRGDLITVFKYMKCGYKEDGDRLFSGGVRTRSNGLKFQQEKVRMDIRKNFLIARVVKYWN